MIKLITIPVLLGAAAGLYALVGRRRMLRWGATDDELAGPFPGADIVPGGKRGATMAVTINATPARLWPWLVQMGCDRAGWYSWDRLDNWGRRSAERIHAEWQSLTVGQRIQSDPKGKHWFEVAAVEPERCLALRACFTKRGRQYDSKLPRPDFFLDTLWAFQLKALPEGRTRLIVSGYTAAPRRFALTAAAYLFWQPAHWIMQTRQFANLKRRAEHPFWKTTLALPCPSKR